MKKKKLKKLSPFEALLLAFGLSNLISWLPISISYATYPYYISSNIFTSLHFYLQMGFVASIFFSPVLLVILILCYMKNKIKYFNLILFFLMQAYGCFIFLLLLAPGKVDEVLGSSDVYTNTGIRIFNFFQVSVPATILFITILVTLTKYSRWRKMRNTISLLWIEILGCLFYNINSIVEWSIPTFLVVTLPATILFFIILILENRDFWKNKIRYLIFFIGMEAWGYVFYNPYTISIYNTSQEDYSGLPFNFFHILFLVTTLFLMVLISLTREFRKSRIGYSIIFVSLAVYGYFSFIPTYTDSMEVSSRGIFIPSPVTILFLVMLFISFIRDFKQCNSKKQMNNFIVNP